MTDINIRHRGSSGKVPGTGAVITTGFPPV